MLYNEINEKSRAQNITTVDKGSSVDLTRLSLKEPKNVIKLETGTGNESFFFHFHPHFSTNDATELSSPSSCQLLVEQRLGALGRVVLVEVLGRVAERVQKALGAALVLVTENFDAAFNINSRAWKEEKGE